MILHCQHCQQNPANRPRRLCFRCYEQPEVRSLYPARTKNRAKTSRRNRRLPRFPTWARPGSKAKILVMEQRYSRREQLFHPLDADEFGPEL